MTRDSLRLTPRGLLFAGRLLPCSIGRGGLTSAKQEGDGATPRGRHRITAMLYRPDRIAPPAPWARAIRPGDLWSDDPDDAAYNSLVRAPHPLSHEALRRADPLYDLVLVMDWNAEGRPGAGSAIFLHQWRRPGFPTAGCIALSRPALHALARQLTPGTPLIV
ncbi:L,D-transpeptidase family protein [Pseudoroseicyclus tamaricis]|uniref:L,D-transpeptidase family protein n=1 Tax=Pseudoroseicyclus tamaricis TaxID=2705421 RepID=A0A6B2JLW4_9RHOB|nr:L,D-transpeptidase family protein [Pseudoroseicyclus tamaricis]NDV02561.1 L,D-transpeptidase family protein [Pseudoroseicyclus tamaricis]